VTIAESMETLRRELAALRETIEKSPAGERDLYSAEEVARRLSISLSTVRVLIARGELRYLRIGNLVRVPRSAIDRFCRANHYDVWGAKDPQTGRTRRPARMRPGTHGTRAENPKEDSAGDGHGDGKRIGAE
jgi:excisionase family DNA binding protein